MLRIFWTQPGCETGFLMNFDEHYQKTGVGRHYVIFSKITEIINYFSLK